MEAAKNMVDRIEDDTDEFEVISREDEKEEVNSFGVTYKHAHDDVASTVCDEEGGLDRAEDSAVPSRCESLLHSMCSLAPFSTDNPQQYEKFLEVVKEESEKNRFVLEQIASMVEQLTKEKSDNTELRAKVLSYESQIKKLDDELSKLDTSMKDQEITFQEKLRSLTANLNETMAQNSRKDARIAELTATIAEKDLRILSLEHELQSAAPNNAEIENAQKALEKQQRENASQAEIIRLLQEEIAEGERLLTKARKDYRDKLDEISEQWERNYRAEVNH
uniref:Uncharacterized protein n=1 Tax=Acrobeloides nanus TaxID=290746 RepID=A0A914CFR0_9BILA